jgi:nicotinate phosphoribosyltransferase
LYTPPSLDEPRDRSLKQVNELQPGIRRFVNPHRYPVGLESRLSDLRTKLLTDSRKTALD